MSQPNKSQMSFKSLTTAAYLRSKGFPLDDAHIDHQGDAIFHFQETTELMEVLRLYDNGLADVNRSRILDALKGLLEVINGLSKSRRGNDI